MTFRNRLLLLFVTTPIVAFAVVGGFLGKASAREDGVQHLRLFEDVVGLILSNYVEEVEFERVMEGAMRGLSEGLDPDSAYLRREEVLAVESGDALPPGEVGLELTRRYYLGVIAAREGSPAARAGLRTGDLIRAIDGQSTRDISVFHGTRLLRGPVGSNVELTIIRGNMAEPHTLTLQRETARVPVVTGRMLEGRVGYIRVPAFTEGTPDHLQQTVAELTRRGASQLVIDLRNTAEGPLEAGLASARLFVSEGTIAIQETRGASRQPVPADRKGGVTLPAAVLINTGTSGAAELFAAALGGNERAALIGERTLGRAAEQRLVKLPDGTGLWMTWARYLGPSGDPIHTTGLEPNVEVEEPDVEFGAPAAEEDPILDKALEHLTAVPAAA